MRTAWGKPHPVRDPKAEQIPEWCWRMIRYFGDYQNGLLLHGGGVGDQPALYLRAMHWLSAERHNIEEEERRHKAQHKPMQRIGSRGKPTRSKILG